MAAEQGWVDGHLQMGTMYYRKFTNIVFNQLLPAQWGSKYS